MSPRLVLLPLLLLALTALQTSNAQLTFSLRVRNDDSRFHRFCVYTKPLRTTTWADVLCWRELNLPGNSSGQVEMVAEFQVGFSSFYSGDQVGSTEKDPVPVQLGNVYVVGTHMMMAQGKRADGNDILVRLNTAEFRDITVELYLKSGSNGFRKAARQRVEPGLTAAFNYHPSLYAAIVENVVEGDPITSNVQSDALRAEFTNTFMLTARFYKDDQGLLTSEVQPGIN